MDWLEIKIKIAFRELRAGFASVVFQLPSHIYYVCSRYVQLYWKSIVFDRSNVDATAYDANVDRQYLNCD